MIVAHALDFPKVVPDNWYIFWQMWNTHAKNLVKVKDHGGSYQSVASVGNNSAWLGFDVYRSSSYIDPVWWAPYVNISKVLPKMYDTLTTVNLPEISLIRIIKSLKNHDAHCDRGTDTWEVRAMLHCDNPAEHWYYTPYGNKSERVGLTLPSETNWFTYNDATCHHGTYFYETRPKLLVQIFYNAEKLPIEIRKAGIDKYPHCVIEF